LQELLN